jgi:hypothetical protein
MNPKFTLEMTEEETLGVLAHECMHIMTLSFFRQKGRENYLWNIATDFVMNRDLVEMKMALPEGGCIPEQRGNQMFAVIKEPSGATRFEEFDTPEFITTFKGYGDEISFYDGSSFEVVDRIGNVYNRLVIWDAKTIHAATKYYGNDINNSRFFQLFFFDVE